MLIAVLLFSGIAFSQDSAIKIRQEFPNNALVVSIENANGVAGYQFDINYNPAVLKYREISFGDFLSGDGVQTFKVNPKTEINGLIKAVAEARTGRNQGLNGNGTLFTVEFERVSEGNTGLKLAYSKVVDVEGNEIRAEIMPLPQMQAKPNEVPSISSEYIIIITAVIVAIIGADLLLSRKNNRN